jgi:amidase
MLLITWMLLCFSCGESRHGTPFSEINDTVVLWTPYNDSAEVAANKTHKLQRMQYKLIQSRVSNKNDIFRPLYREVSAMPEKDYQRLKPLILGKTIPEIQTGISAGKMTYEELVLFYLHRIYSFELDNATTLNTILALNKDVVAQARELDMRKRKDRKTAHHPVYGMPILLKDNINTAGMNTTAGAIALNGNEVEDAFIVKQLKAKGALILGKVNLSEWAYFLCSGCPVGYSAVGGQTLNPYGRRKYETGGSSSGSGTAMAAEYAVAAVGTETSGSILSPSGQNSVVGLKPTVGLLSRSGIVPISGTLDTPGPMTRNVTDNAILLDAMTGLDEHDSQSVRPKFKNSWENRSPEGFALKGKRLGVFRQLLTSDTLYMQAIQKLKKAGALIFEFTPPEVSMDGFISILNLDMKNDLPAYLETYGNNSGNVTIHSVAEAAAFNKEDSMTRIPYGQAVFEGILADTTSPANLLRIKSRLQLNGRAFFDTAMNEHKLDAILSVNNTHAGYAAVAKYPALTVPMGYRTDGEPVNLTFIGKSYQEETLLNLGMAFETLTRARKLHQDYH